MYLVPSSYCMLCDDSCCCVNTVCIRCVCVYTLVCYHQRGQRCVRVSSVMFTCVTAVVSENLLAGLGKCHPGKGRGEGFRVHLAARALQVIILPRLSVRRLKHQPTRLHVIKPFMIPSVDARRVSATEFPPRRRASARPLRASRYSSRRESENGSYRFACKPRKKK